MVKATAQQVFENLKTAGLPVKIVDGLNDWCWFDGNMIESTVRTVLDPLEWTGASIRNINDDPADPYPQYLNLARHDQLLRHELGVVVPKQDVDGTAFDNAIIFGGD